MDRLRKHVLGPACWGVAGYALVIAGKRIALSVNGMLSIPENLRVMVPWTITAALLLALIAILPRRLWRKYSLDLTPTWMLLAFAAAFSLAEAFAVVYAAAHPRSSSVPSLVLGCAMLYSLASLVVRAREAGTGSRADASHVSSS